MGEEERAGEGRGDEREMRREKEKPKGVPTVVTASRPHLHH